MRKTEITCDGCGADITTTGNSVDYGLVLASEAKPHSGRGFCTDVMICPPIKCAHYFCRLACLDRWTDRRRYKDSLWNKATEQWKEEHGACIGDRLFSYPCRPQEMTEMLDKQFTAAAIEAFPMI
jgi:hypothetical protein